MRKYKLIVLSILVVFSSSNILAQKQKRKSVQFNYIQKPLIKIPIDWSYNVKVFQKNIEDLESRRKAYLGKLERAEEKYQDKLKAYRALSASERLLTKEPKKKNIEEYFIGADIDLESTAASLGEIIGFRKSNSSEFTVHAIFDGFSYVASNLQATSDNTGYFYLVEYKNPVLLKLVDNTDIVIHEKSYSQEIESFKTKVQPSKAEAEKAWKSNKVSTLKSIESKSNNTQMERLTEEINFLIGYPKIKTEIDFFSGKGKKVEYPELDIALENTQRGLISFSDDEQLSANRIMDAVKIWEEKLNEGDLSNKKAKFNKILVSALHLNLGFSHTILGDFVSAKDHLAEVEVLGVARFIDDTKKLEGFIEEFEQRGN